jgi:hypothetical protein
MIIFECCKGVRVESHGILEFAPRTKLGRDRVFKESEERTRYGVNSKKLILEGRDIEFFVQSH